MAVLAKSHRISGSLVGFVLWLGYAGAQSPAKGEDLGSIYKQFQQKYEAGAYAEAERLGTRMVELAERQFGRDSPKTAATLSNLGSAYQVQGRYADAVPSVTDCRNFPKPLTSSAQWQGS